MTKILPPELRIKDLNALSIPSRIWIQQQVDISIYTSAHVVLLFRFCFHSIKQTSFSCCAHLSGTLYSMLFCELHLLHTLSNTRHVVVTGQTVHCTVSVSDLMDTLPSLPCAQFQDICKAHNAISLRSLLRTTTSGILPQMLSIIAVCCSFPPLCFSPQCFPLNAIPHNYLHLYLYILAH